MKHTNENLNYSRSKKGAGNNQAEYSERLGSSINKLNDQEFQASLLNGVSRTFALTIPQLPIQLREVVSNAYLLCRTIDTIEDEPQLSVDQKALYSDQFLRILETGEDPNQLSKVLLPLLSKHTIPAEHQLIRQLDQVVKITNSFKPEQRQSLIRCVKIMSEGMIYYQNHSTGDGLENQKEMDRYCYYVAGVVGEMLTELFCLYSSEISKSKDQLMILSRSFGQGLQMTNILKDIWADQERSACWLPKDLFTETDIRLNNLKSITDSEPFEKGIEHLIGIAHSHLSNALSYTLLIPAHETGIRKFCLWALGMGILTLRKIHKNLNFKHGDQVKISRNSVKSTIAITSLTARHNGLLSYWFNFIGNKLPKVPISLDP